MRLPAAAFATTTALVLLGSQASAASSRMRTVAAIDPTLEGEGAFARGATPAASPTSSATPTSTAQAAPSADARPRPAQPSFGIDSRQLRFGLRLVHGVPLGLAEAVSGGELSQMLGQQTYFHVEAGRRVNDYVTVGMFVGLGIGAEGAASEQLCAADGMQCKSLAFRLGGEVQVHLAPGRTVNPRLGFGFGGVAEGSTIKSGSSTVASIAYSGWELARLSAGLDVRVGKQLTLGPTVDFASGIYTSGSVSSSRGEVSGSLTTVGLHHWLSAGLRMAVLP